MAFAHRLFGFSISGVRRVDFAPLLQVMKTAERVEGLAYGNRTWLVGRREDIDRLYLVRLPRRNHQGFVKCALIVISRNNQGVWMNLDVRRRIYSRLPRITASEMEDLTLNLAIRFSFVRMPEDPMFDADVEFS